ncbi:MAG: hypothetical protein AB2L22_13235 [Syntrophales bacterium]
MPYGNDHADDYDLDREDEDQEIPDVDWAEDIKKIDDDDLRRDEIQKAQKLLAEDQALRDRLDRGEISLNSYVSIRQGSIFPQMRKARTRCGLESVGMTFDDLGDLAEDMEFLLPTENKMSEMKDRLKTKIETVGPVAAQEHADRLFDEEELSKDAHDRISRQVRISKRKRG